MVRKNMQAGIISKISMLGADRSVIYALKNLKFNLYKSKYTIYTSNKSDILGYGDRGVSCLWYVDQIRQYYNDLKYKGSIGYIEEISKNYMEQIESSVEYDEYLRIAGVTEFNGEGAGILLDKVWGAIAVMCNEETKISLETAEDNRDYYMSYILDPMAIIRYYLSAVRYYIGILIGIDNGIVRSIGKDRNDNYIKTRTKHRYDIDIETGISSIKSVKIYRVGDSDKSRELCINRLSIKTPDRNYEADNCWLTHILVYENKGILNTHIEWETGKKYGRLTLK